ncbi:MAG: hypothetical protein ICV64_03295 [Thermoleophilia bacterium]|nr:hypothetical protein [Thermoleophilia bacterium]
MVAAGGELRLRSAVFDETWDPGRPLRAACGRGHAAPDPACACGVYAVCAPADAVRYLVGRDDPGVLHRVLGQVALWGVTVEGERGWRAERARPLRLLTPTGRTNAAPVDAAAIASALALAYAVPVELISESEPPALVSRFS